MAAAGESELPLVSALFITYKRVHLLRMSLEAFRKNTDYPRLEIVISDDGSGPEIQEQIRALKADVYALAAKNAGLGANNNNGIRHCNGKYILMIQDDWECCGPPDYLTNTIRVMEANPSVAIVNYCGEPNWMDESIVFAGSGERCVATKTSREARNRNFRYSDQPHVVTREATDFIGPYVEDRALDEAETEEEYNRRWLDQTRYISAVFPAYYMRTFANRGIEESFRTSRFQNRAFRALMPIARFLKARFGLLYRIGNWAVRGSLKLLMKLRIVR